MLNKFFIFYATLMLTMVLSVMFLLISAEIATFSIKKGVNVKTSQYQNNNKQDIDSLSDSENLKIFTDKNTYLPSEKVTINFFYKGEGKMVQMDNPSINVKTRPDIGKNFEVAFIEHKEADDWIAIEPVKRCDSDCNSSCQEKTQIQSEGMESFVWEQKLLKCTDDENKIVSAPTGEYRISSAKWDEAKQSYKMISSEVFNISTLSRNDK